MAATSESSPALPRESSPARTTGAPGRLALVLVSNGLFRIAGGASGVLVGVYVADLADRGFALDAALVGTLAAVSFGAELAGAIPLGLVADAVSTRMLMSGGALLAALATLLFGLTHEIGVFLVSRAIEGLAAAAAVPALLAHITDATSRDPALRARTMSYFELSLLAGLALGGLLGSQLWSALGARAFSALALVYVLAALLLYAGGAGARRGSGRGVWAGFGRSLRQPSLRRLAPIWLCMNAIIGLWIGPTLYFLLTRRSGSGQLLSGLLADDPALLGWLLFAYALVFGAGLVGWSIVLPRIELRRALRASLFAMLAVSAGLLILNHAGAMPVPVRWTLTAAVAGLIMIESGFTPAALSLLAGAVGSGEGRGAAMGIYSFLLSLGALAGSILAGVAGQRFAIDGLIYATIGLTALALVLLARLDPARPQPVEAS